MAYFIFTLWIALRAFPRILNPQILSEDGRTFLNQAFELGWSSVFQAYAGYFHTLPRILALTAIHLPIEWMPQVLGLPCLIIFALLLARMCSDDFSEIFGDKRQRFLAALLLSLTPGLYEVLGNPTNIHWILSLYLAIMALRNFSTPLKTLDWIMILLAVSSGGECLALFPIFLLRLYYARPKFPEAFVLFSIFVFALLNFVTRQSGPGLHFDFFSKLPSAVTYLWNNWILLQPLVGDHATHYLGEKLDILYWTLSLALTSLLFQRIYQKRDGLLSRKNTLLLFFCFSLCGMLGMIWIARIEAFGIFNQITRDAGYSLTRYSFLPGVLALIFHLSFWPLVFDKFQNSKWPLFLVMWTLLLSPHRFFLAAHEPQHPTWKQKLQALDSECSEEKVSIEIWPQDWVLKVPRQKLQNYCPGP